MSCFTTAVVLFLLTHITTTYARGIHVSIFSNPDTAMSFARTFVDNLARCGEFDSQETEDFDEIIESLVKAQGKGSKGRRSNSAKAAKAMKMALASSVAELIVEESGGVDMQLKTNAAIDALRDALRSTSGKVDEVFVKEIEELVDLFSKEQVDDASSEQTSAEGDQGGAPTVTETVTINVGRGGAPQPSGVRQIYQPVAPSVRKDGKQRPVSEGRGTPAVGSGPITIEENISAGGGPDGIRPKAGTASPGVPGDLGGPRARSTEGFYRPGTDGSGGSCEKRIASGIEPYEEGPGAEVIYGPGVTGTGSRGIYGPGVTVTGPGGIYGHEVTGIGPGSAYRHREEDKEHCFSLT